MTGRAKIFLIMTQSFNFILSGKKKERPKSLFLDHSVISTYLEM